jgi:hypothetical protein
MRIIIKGVVLNDGVLQYEEQLRSKASAMVPNTKPKNPAPGQ